MNSVQLKSYHSLKSFQNSHSQQTCHGWGSSVCDTKQAPDVEKEQRATEREA